MMMMMRGKIRSRRRLEPGQRIVDKVSRGRCAGSKTGLTYEDAKKNSGSQGSSHLQTRKISR